MDKYDSRPTRSELGRDRHQRTEQRSAVEVMTGGRKGPHPQSVVFCKETADLLIAKLRAVRAEADWLNRRWQQPSVRDDGPATAAMEVRFPLAPPTPHTITALVNGRLAQPQLLPLSGVASPGRRALLYWLTRQ